MKRILIVDDNTEYLQILSSVLSGEFETIKATGVEDALDTLQTITVDAICSDFNMKDGTGLDLLEKIRQQGLKTPFLLMSGDNSRALEQKAKLYYGDFCCKTDFDLVEKIKALVNNMYRRALQSQLKPAHSIMKTEDRSMMRSWLRSWKQSLKWKELPAKNSVTKKILCSFPFVLVPELPCLV